MRRRLLFLDIDGVLNHGLGDGFTSIHRENVVALNLFLEKSPPDTRIVLSTSWRYMVLEGATTLKGFEYLLHSHGAAVIGRIVGHTDRDENYTVPPNKMSGWLDEQARVRQVRDYLRTQGDDVISFACVDDMPLRFEDVGLPGRFVQTDGQLGLTEEKATELVEAIRRNLTREEERAVSG